MARVRCCWSRGTRRYGLTYETTPGAPRWKSTWSFHPSNKCFAATGAVIDVFVFADPPYEMETRSSTVNFWSNSSSANG